ncbi:hypothetical protein BAGA_24525 [Bacillus gaemokensis]|uniref:Uncharacterized protein n=1 Tax=Bacillus gaemokensis TaxID=574375 RepID=A0A073KHR8_9BACI|nr:hypothetical protein BAGA_24525 [Bacillus gaemokensis]KYG30322.1 hypothetical protein AZF08_13380 [Bacillus gaemokensis]
MFNKMRGYLLFGIFLILGATFIFIVSNYSFNVYVILPNSEKGTELLSNRIATIGFVICAILFFRYLINYLVSKTKK